MTNLIFDIVIAHNGDEPLKDTLLPTRLFLLMRIRQIIQHQYVQPASWKWTVGFGTCSR